MYSQLHHSVLHQFTRYLRLHLITHSSSAAIRIRPTPTANRLPPSAVFLCQSQCHSYPSLNRQFIVRQSPDLTSTPANAPLQPTMPAAHRLDAPIHNTVLRSSGSLGMFPRSLDPRVVCPDHAHHDNQSLLSMPGFFRLRPGYAVPSKSSFPFSPDPSQ